MARAEAANAPDTGRRSSGEAATEVEACFLASSSIIPIDIIATPDPMPTPAPARAQRPRRLREE